jgi:hypothetical protein
MRAQQPCRKMVFLCGTLMTTAWKRLSKQSPIFTLLTIEGHPLPGKGSVNKHYKKTEEKCFLLGPCSCRSTTGNENEKGARPSDTIAVSR